MGEDGLHWYDCFGYYEADIFPNDLAIMPEFFELIQDRSQWSFMADVHSFWAVIELELGAGFVDGVVGEMHEQVAEIFLLGLGIGWIDYQLRSVAKRANPSL